MKIRDIQRLKLRRRQLVQKGFWEERLVRPIDIFERFRDAGPETIGEEKVFEQIFLEITIDEGKQEIFGPGSARVAVIIEEELKPFILGEDPFSVEKIWSIMYRSQVHGRKGD